MRKISFKHRIWRFNIILIIMLVIFMCVYYMLSQITTRKYNESIQIYDDVNEFYNSIAQANFSFKSYLYTENNEDILTYHKQIKSAKENLEDTKKNISPQYKWRVMLLENMLSNYQKAAQHTKDIMGKENQEYQAEYNNLLRQYELIEKTSTTYYEYITEDIKGQRSEINEYERLVFSISLFIMLIGIAWIIVFSTITIRSLTNPLYSILRNIKLIKKGEYDLSDVSNTSQEMETLCLALGDMAENVKHNILNEKEKAKLQNELLEKENENLRKDELLAFSELRMLQNQINPHFLFNTLNMIYKTAYAEHAEHTSAMVEKTSELLRYALDKSNRTSDLYSEVQSIRNYIYIQEKRFHRRIEFNLNIERNVPNIQVPGLLIQPLIENSVKHGVGDMIEGGEIFINIKYLDEHIIISVSDTGKGLATDILEEGIMNDFQSADKNNLGLYNVIQRIKMFYGRNAEISFNSYPGCGFEVIIDIMMKQPYV